MTTKKTAGSADDDSLGVLDDAASLDTSGIGIIGASTAQVSVVLPTGDDDDDLLDDGVLDGEVATDLIIDDIIEPLPAGRFADGIDLVIEVPEEDLPGAAAHTAAAIESESTIEDAVIDDAPAPVEPSGAEPTSAAATVDEPEAAVDTVAAEIVTEAEIVEAGVSVDESAEVLVAATQAPAASKPRAGTKSKKAAKAAKTPDAAKPAKPAKVQEPAKVQDVAKPAIVKPRAVQSSAVPAATPAPAVAEPASARPISPWVSSVESAAAGTTPDAAELASDTVPDSAEKATEIVSIEKDNRAPQSAVARHAPARSDVELTSKRIGEQRGQATRESADLLTADRLLDPNRITKPEPEGAWSHFLYALSGRRINIGDGKKAKARKALSAKIAAPLTGGARFVPVLSRKGGVGKTAITALLGMALADARDDRVIAIDANPDRGTLAERIVRTHSKSVRDLVRVHDQVRGYHDISAIVGRDATRLDVLASDSDPRIADAFGDADYRDVADVAAHYYSLVLTDTGTGIVHSVMGATLELADQIVIVSGLSVDEARLASETLTWLETNGYAEQARAAIVVLNQSTPGAPMVRLNELQAHFATRAAHVVRMPYDPQIAGGGPIVFASLQPETRQAARELAALLIEGLRVQGA